MAVNTLPTGFRRKLQSGQGPRPKRNEELGFSQPYYSAKVWLSSSHVTPLIIGIILAITPKSSMGDYITSKSSLEDSKGGFIPQYNLHCILPTTYISPMSIYCMLRRVISQHNVYTQCILYILFIIVYTTLIYTLASYVLFTLKPKDIV